MSADTFDAAALVAGVATAMTAVGAWPQLHKLRRTGDTAGVSLSTATLSCSAETGWAIYLAGAGLWTAVPEAVVTLTVSVALTAALIRAGAMWLRPAAAAAGWLAALLVARAAGGLHMIGALLSITYAVQLSPAVWTAWRTSRPSGIAASSWVIRLTQSALWGGYGLLRGDRPLFTLGLIGTAASAAILARTATGSVGRGLRPRFRTHVQVSRTLERCRVAPR